MAAIRNSLKQSRAKDYPDPCLRSRRWALTASALARSLCTVRAPCSSQHSVAWSCSMALSNPPGGYPQQRSGAC